MVYLKYAVAKIDIHITFFKTNVSLKLMIVMSGFCLIFMTLFVDKN